MPLLIVPISLREANEFVAAHHRHHKPARGCKFVTACTDDGRLCGVAIVGRPVSRELQRREPLTCEVLRVCTDGTRNACSLLYGACRRAAFAIGYTRVITYTLPDEGGASLRAAGFVIAYKTHGDSWNRPSRERDDDAPLCPKWCWEVRRS